MIVEIVLYCYHLPALQLINGKTSKTEGIFLEIFILKNILLNKDQITNFSLEILINYTLFLSGSIANHFSLAIISKNAIIYKKLQNMEHLQRHNMVRNQVRVIGVEDERILNAMLEIEREKFIIDKFQSVAYSDSELPISDSRLIARPEMIAKFLEIAQITHNDIIYDIGCGTGYGSHIISRIAKDILGIDNCKNVIATAKKLIGNRQNLAFKYQDFNNLSIPSDVSLILINGAVFNKRADFSMIQDKDDLFDFHSAMLVDDIINKMPHQCRLLCVEGYYKYHPMHATRYTKDSREVLDQIYFSEINL